MFNIKKITLLLLGLTMQNSPVSNNRYKISPEQTTLGSAGFAASFVGTAAKLFDYSAVIHTNRANLLIKLGANISGLALISLIAGTGYKDLYKKSSEPYSTPALLTGAAAGVTLATLPFAAGQAGLIAGAKIGNLLGKSSINGARVGQAALLIPTALLSSGVMTGATYQAAKNLWPTLKNNK